MKAYLRHTPLPKPRQGSFLLVALEKQASLECLNHQTNYNIYEMEKEEKAEQRITVTTGSR